MRKHNEEKSKSRMEAKGKQREAENFRQNTHSHACHKRQTEMTIATKETS
jgi:hypothetical protein